MRIRQKTLKTPEGRSHHLRNNIYCVVAIDTTGDNPKEHEIHQICIWLLDAVYIPSKKHMPFVFSIKPEKPVDFKTTSTLVGKLRDAGANGTDSFLVMDKLEEWFESLNLPEGGKIVPITFNWPKVRDFLTNWLPPLTYRYVFHRRYYIDLVSFLIFHNEYQAFHGKATVLLDDPDNEENDEHQKYLMLRKFGIEVGQSDDVMVRCIAYAKTFARLALFKFDCPV